MTQRGAHLRNGGLRTPWRATRGYGERGLDLRGHVSGTMGWLSRHIRIRRPSLLTAEGTRGSALAKVREPILINSPP